MLKTVKKWFAGCTAVYLPAFPSRLLSRLCCHTRTAARLASIRSMSDFFENDYDFSAFLVLSSRSCIQLATALRTVMVFSVLC